MRNYYYSFEINLENPHIREHLKGSITDLTGDDITELNVNSRLFNDAAACLEALHADLNKKVEVLKISKSKDAVTSINETNPAHSNSAEDLEKFVEEHPEYNEYLETWAEDEVVRLTYTTEEFDEETPPIINDEHAMIFRYIIHEFEDHIEVPEGKTFIDLQSSVLH